MFNTLNDRGNYTMNTDMEFAGSVREKFAKNMMYTDNRIVELADSITSSLNYLFNEFIPVPSSCEIILLMKDVKLNKDCFELYKIIDPIMDTFFNKYNTELCSILSPEEVERFYKVPKSMFYYIEIIGNGIVIKL